MEYQIYYEEKQDHTLIILKMIGQSPVVYIPSMIEGKKVTEIGAYCFSKTEIQKNWKHTKAVENGTILSLNYIEEVYCPDSITSIQACAFYNCRKLKAIHIHEIQVLSHDVFMNCLSLHDIYSFSIDSMKPMLSQISWNITVHTSSFSIFFPEYYEVYNEIGPAHIFGIEIQGEGYRMRQCFKNNLFLFEEYDACFDKLKKEEKKEVACFVAYMRLLFPEKIHGIKEYEDFIIENQDICLSWIDASSFDRFKDYFNQDSILSLMDTKKEDIELITKCIAYNRMRFKKNRYNFEDL
ncbi:leucine-rich repeat protein [Floccifex sp.]|uniref:leucine-rich repeat protein n=1 Tax=Floccifex sp. TaxID=2815810 RepID=UPI003F10A2EE